MNAVILTCSSLTSHVDAAQKKMNTHFPVMEMDRKYHDNPAYMRKIIIEQLKDLPEEIDTILVAMGFCGGSWENICLNKRIVIPKVDDCITLLLYTDDQWHLSLKKPGHMYLRDSDVKEYSITAMYNKLRQKYGGRNGDIIFRSMFAHYTNVDIIDTGVYDCYSESYVAQAQEDANLIGAVLDYTEGSNLILEKLVSGQWEQQFLILKPGQTLSTKDFIS